MKTDRYSLRKFGRRMAYYASNFALYALPRGVYKCWWAWRYDRLSPEQKEVARRRAEYYCQLAPDAELPDVGGGQWGEQGEDFGGKVTTVGAYRFPWRKKKRLTTYFFDLYREIATLPASCRFSYIFGDVRQESPQPAFVKTRMIGQGPRPSVLCRLNALRHFWWVKDRVEWQDKKPQLVSRNIVGQEHRRRFVAMYHDHPLCNVGRVNAPDDPTPGWRPYMPMAEQLQYRYIACIEGNDVATNLKWVMSSNSIAVMPRPTCESWFMEDTLIPNVHYICIADDYHDLPERLQYYNTHPEEAQRILKAAHAYVQQFQDTRLEHYTQRLVMERYMQATKGEA